MSQRVSVQARHGTRDATLVLAIKVFEENLEDPPRPCEVAAEIGIPMRQLERLFDRHLGTSPKRYALEQRLDRARNLIVQSEQSLAEIAMASGFNSTFRFSRLFRERFGVSSGTQRSRLS